jgi:pyruvate/2-oxoglutarate dehydrogenase complex dihydrolipoamide dehydrogenase (E3) component
MSLSTSEPGRRYHRIPGLTEARPLTSETLLALERIPERLVVLGGGYVGLELAQAMQRLGSRVTVVERSAQVLAREDEDIAAAVAEIFRQDGIEILLDSTVQSVVRPRMAASGLSFRPRPAPKRSPVTVYSPRWAASQTPKGSG